MEQSKIINMILDNMNKLFYPEDWLELDIKFSKSELFALLIVDRYGEAIMSQISNESNVSMSTATGIIDRLVKKKYLVRERSKSDRRIVLIRLTDKGQQTIKAMKDSIYHYINIIYESLSEEEIRVLSGIMVKVIDAFNKDKSVEKKQNAEKTTIKKIEIE